MAAGCLLLAAVEKSYETLGDEGKDPAIHDAAVMDERVFDGRGEDVGAAAIASTLLLGFLVEVPVDSH